MGIEERIDAITLVTPDYQSPTPPCPKSVKIELTGRCNYRCGFCALRMRDCQPGAKDDMSLDEFKRITTEMYEAGVEEIGLFFLGESLSAPELTIAACEWLKSDLGMPYVFLTTNGSLATEEILEGLMRAGLDSLKFSINAASFEQFEEVMGVKSKLYKRALDAVRIAAQVKARGDYPCNIYASSIQYDGEQQQRMEQLLDQYVRPWVQSHYWLPLYSMGSVATQREAELGYRPTAGNQGRIGALRKPLPCWSAFTEGHVRADSKVSLCCFDADGRFVVGDLKQQSWMDVWHSPKFQAVRKAHLAEDVTGTVCENCIAY
jgi:MoaA/NifB/PqqE/SkfB family radical SAM enzyme